MNNEGWFLACEEAGIVECDHFILHGGFHTDTYVNFATLLACRPPLLDEIVSRLAALISGEKEYVIIGTGNGAHFANLVVQAVHAFARDNDGVGKLPKFAYASRFDAGGRLQFRRNQEAIVKNASVIIIDDVFVTGSTLTELEELVWRSGGSVQAECLILNRNPARMTERSISLPLGVVVPFHSIFQWSSTFWPSANFCPQCIAGVPINLEVGKGAEYHRLHGHPLPARSA